MRRALALEAWRTVGKLQRWSGGWRALTLLAVVGVVAVLVLAQGSISRVVAVVAAAAGALLVGVRCRKQVIVEPFADYTGRNAKAVEGLAALLINELDRLRRDVETDEIPAAVGIERVGGFGRSKERQEDAARFVTASSDGLSDFLQGAVPADAKLGLGLVTIPIGPLLSLGVRLARGSHFHGSVHDNAAGDGLILTAQLVGGPVTGSWRVERPSAAEAGSIEPTGLDAMVRELACRVFADITFAGSGRWRAVRAFAEYVRIYKESHDARELSGAEGKLLEALAEDPRFGLASYNLGVVYRRLAHAAAVAESAPLSPTSPGRSTRPAVLAARRQAARVALWNAIKLDPRLGQAHYALAVAQYEAIPEIELGERPPDASRESLQQVIRGCLNALELCPSGTRAGVAHDLMGMAQARIGTAGDIAAAIRSHRKAVAALWKELCQAERVACANPGTEDGRVQQARDNAAAALHNLALAHAHRAMLAERPPAAGDFALADHIFGATIRLARALPECAAAPLFERGRAREYRGSLLKADHPRRAAKAFKKAAEAYAQAADVKATHAEYPACRARALALYLQTRANDPEHQQRRAGVSTRGHRQDAALRRAIAEQARRALRELAPALRCLVAPLTPLVEDEQCRRTLGALQEAYELVGDTDGEKWARALSDLADELRRAGRLPKGTTEPGPCHQQLTQSIARLHALQRASAPLSVPGGWARSARHHPTEQHTGDGDHLSLYRDQIDMALARLYAADGNWTAARITLEAVIARFTSRGPSGVERIVDFALRAEYARALRRTGLLSAALREIEECRRANPLCLDGHREAARVHYAMGHLDQALSAWEQALRLAPDDADAHVSAAICHCQLADLLGRSGACDGDARATHLAGAATHLETALAAFEDNDSPTATWARLCGGYVALERGLTGQSIQVLTDAFGGPTGRAARLFLAQAGLERGGRGVCPGCVRRLRGLFDRSAGEQLGDHRAASEIAHA